MTFPGEIPRRKALRIRMKEEIRVLVE